MTENTGILNVELLQIEELEQKIAPDDSGHPERNALEPVTRGSGKLSSREIIVALTSATHAVRTECHGSKAKDNQRASSGAGPSALETLDCPRPT